MDRPPFSLIAFFAVLLAAPVLAQPAFVVDRPEVPASPASAAPRGAVEHAGVLYFTAVHPLTGRELWRWDGAGEPELVVDLCPGRESSDLGELTPYQDRLFFLARSCFHGPITLWSTDGTAAGTLREVELEGLRRYEVVATATDLYVNDPNLGPLAVLRGSSLVELASSARVLTPVGDRLFFVGGRSLDLELWTTDGTPEGTGLVRDIAPGEASAFLHSGGGTIFERDGVLYFAVRDADGCGFWRSDGSFEGTWEVADLPDAETCAPGPQGRTAAAGGFLFFAAARGEGWGLYRSDGTAAGTVPVGPVSAIGLHWPTAVGDDVFFISSPDGDNWNLWVVDATSVAPEARLATNAATLLPSGVRPWRLKAFDGRLLFTTERPPGLVLWSSDGSAAGTVRIADIPPPETGFRPFPGSRLGAELGGRLVFPAKDEDLGTELWETDGTAAGTRLAVDLNPGPESLDPGPILTADGEPPAVFLGAGRLWAADAAAARVLTPLTGDDPAPFSPVRAAGHVFFRRSGGQVWSVDAAGTVELIAEPFCSILLTAYRDQAYFVSWTRDEGYGLYRSGGGPAELATPLPQDLFYFPWAGPSGVPPGPCDTTVFPDRFGDDLVLSSFGQVLVTDGTEDGTRLLFPEVCADRACEIGDVAAADGVLYVLAGREDEVLELWRTTGGETREVLAEIPTRRAGRLVPWNGSLVFTAATPATGEELWIVDTPGATPPRLLADLRPGPGDAAPADLLVHGGRLFFTALGSFDGQEVGRELWVADGGGVRPLADLNPGPASAFSRADLLYWDTSPRRLAAAGEHLLFGADDGVHGSELWASDGTAEGTRLLQDLVPGPLASSPRGFAVAGGDVFWNAGTADGGFELWTMPFAALTEEPEEPEEPPPSCPADTACQREGRFTVTVRFRNQHARPVTDGVGRPLPLTDETSLFWFFNPDNVELVVKVLDGRRINGHFWVFYGGLSDVEYWITVTDTESSVERVYHNPPGEICGQGDTQAFPENP